ncbi:MAG: TIGR03013 family PEP-CTERM/XrtA system glycosyltransferase [Magnetococcales bacterium]|nr:TIGR03013 family PEP-CTERM/XrtA system glycosyltransferase [Magnetococcales bacterium]
MIRIFKHYISRWSLLLFCSESGLFLLAIYAGVALRFLGAPHDEDIHSDMMVAKALFFAIAMSIGMTATGRYQRVMEDGWIGEMLRILLSFVIGLVALSLLFYFFPVLFIGRGAFGLALIVAFISILINRWFFIQFILDRDVTRRRVLVLGTGHRARLLTQRLPLSGRDYTILGFLAIDDRQSIEIDPALCIYNQDPLPQLVSDQQIDELVIASSYPLSPEIMHDMMDTKVEGVEVMDLALFLERQQRLIHIDVIDPDWWVANSDGINQGTLREISKKSFDILISLVLVLTTWPIMLLTAAAIWIECLGKEPIFFRQPRVGFGGRIIHILKFRSMRSDAEEDGIARWAQPNDTRVTRIGWFIRKTRIDELPQFLNVLRGEMSLVGPRPERPEFVHVLEKKIPFFNERLRVKPGITGWAQVSYGYGASEEDAAEKLKYDLYYVKNHSLFFDILVLIHSVDVVLFGRGAETSLSHEIETGKDSSSSS